MIEYSSLVEVGATLARIRGRRESLQTGRRRVHLYIVRTGRIQIVTFGTVLEKRRPGGVFGEMALIDEAPRSAAPLPWNLQKCWN